MMNNQPGGVGVGNASGAPGGQGPPPQGGQQRDPNAKATKEDLKEAIEAHEPPQGAIRRKK